ncbi:MAG: hypothetical protein LJE67_03805 [Salaquimonas sp.]|nr:hypothetical protein [Salaquimonas sp.]
MAETATVQSTARARAEALVEELVDNGDLDNLVHLARLIGSAQDSLSDDMISRLAATVSGGLDMLDRANRSGVAKALPAISQLVENGDLDRIVNLARLVGSAEDALTDDMVGRLAAAFGGGLDMLDQANRSGVAKALPAIAQLVENGDLDRIVNLARLVGSAEDALTDDMIGRLARVWSEGLFLVDRLTRSEGFMRLVSILEREDIQNTLTELLQAVSKAREEARAAPVSRGGLGGAIRVVSDPDTQSALRFMASLSKGLTAK